MVQRSRRGLFDGVHKAVEYSEQTYGKVGQDIMGCAIKKGLSQIKVEMKG